jgi:four helix bundle protein
MSHFRDLVAWQRCHELAKRLYRLVKVLPIEERFELSSQIRRAAYSAPANIVEGARKRGKREFRRYLDIANGSLAELEYALLLCFELEYWTPEQYHGAETLRRRAAIATWKLYVSLT